MDQQVIVALIASLVGLIAGAVLARFFLSSQAQGTAAQVKELQSQCENLRGEARSAAISEARAVAARDAALSNAETDRAENVSLSNEIGQQSAELSKSKADKSELEVKLAAAETLVATKNDELNRQKQWFEEQTAHLRSLFGNTANQLLQERAAQFGETNKEQMNALLEPFKQQLTDFRQRVDQIHTAEATVRGQLQNQIAHLAQTASDVGAKADLLANAMLGNVKQQGEWGQLQLTTLLEKAGFVEGKHFDNQYFGENDDKDVRIADTVLRLPNKETLVIDAKVSLPSWTRYCETQDATDRERELMALVASMKAHYQSLAAKDYAQIVGKGLSVPFTVMFVPIEAAGIEAFRAAPDLFNDAQKRKIIIVTPTTLFCVLQLVSALWNIHDKQANALEIADQGRLMLKKLGTFLDSFAAVGKSLQSAAATYETAKGQLQEGRGNLMSLASRWVKLGVEAPSTGELPKLMAIAEDPQEGDAVVSSGAIDGLQ